MIKNIGASQLSFGKDFSLEQGKLYEKSIKKVFELDGKNVTIIQHNTMAPSQEGRNWGVGSNSSLGGEDSFAYYSMHGFARAQEEPPSLNDGSPYDGETFAKNILVIPLDLLTESQFGSLVSEETIKKISEGRDPKTKGQFMYNYTKNTVPTALEEAYLNFKLKSKGGYEFQSDTEKKAIKGLKEGFEDFLLSDNGKKAQEVILFRLVRDEASRRNRDEYKNLTDEALDSDKLKDWSTNDLEAECFNFSKDRIRKELKKQLDTAVWWDPKHWDHYDYENMLSPKNEEEKQRLEDLKNSILGKNKDEVEQFMFNQFLYSTTKKYAAQKYEKEYGIKTISDAQVAFSKADVWAHPNAFLKGWKLGCPPDQFSKDGQGWGFPVLNPDTMFDENSENGLGEAGQLLFDKYYFLFKECSGGVRIDHIIGLVDPFVYKDGSYPTHESSGRLYSSPHNPELAKYAKNTTEEYAQILEKIVIPAAEKAGVSKDGIICEDLGEPNDPTVKVMKMLDLGGINVLAFSDGFHHSGEMAAKNSTITPGSHDNEPLIELAHKITSEEERVKPKNRLIAYKLAKFLIGDFKTPKEVHKYAKRIASDPIVYKDARMAELIASKAKNVQIMNIDFIGDRVSEESPLYNKPGTGPGDNWHTRLGENFKFRHKENLKNGLGVNMALSVLPMMRKRGMDVEHPELYKIIKECAEHMRAPEDEITKLDKRMGLDLVG